MEELNEVDAVGLGCSLDRFVEWSEVFNIIENLQPSTKNDNAGSSFEKDYDRFKYIVNQYQEQPHLLDPYLEEIVSKLVLIVRNNDIPESNRHQAFKYFHLITNVRGYKLIIQHLPHAAADMEPVLSLLEVQNSSENKTWETRYSLLLWICIIVKIPFHLSRLDDPDADASKQIISRLANICHKYIMVGDKCRDICAYLCSQFFTRSDVKDTMLPGFLAFCSQKILEKDSGWKRFGPLCAVAAILKHGKRLDLLPYAKDIFQTVIAMEWKKESYRLSRLYAIKIIQRVGLTYLKTRVISWRYKRGARILPSISEMIGSNEIRADKDAEVVTDAISDAEDDDEVPEELDEIIDQLMQGLRDEDITVRWSAAKGIGRVMGRMNKQFGDEVIGCVLDLLSPRENADAWHGGCLALAEFSKQGLLLPSRLPEIIPLVKRALVYDEPSGYASVGSHIRDAACYVVWTFARAYDPEVFQPFVEDIASSLVVVFCLDREINMRRAAAAAFQEHIGRQGTFPHGIEILTTADYYSVGVRVNTYLNISASIAKYDEYRRPIIDHLVERKIEHWDVAIRELAAKALHNLTEYDSEYMVNSVLPQLMRNVESIDANTRHGSIIAVGEIVHALSLKIDKKLEGGQVEALGEIVSELKRKNYFKGISGELMKLACCQLINKCSLARISFQKKEVVESWQDLIDECLCHEVSNIRTAAAEALPALCTQYYLVNGIRDAARCELIVRRLISKLMANDEILRVGQTLALGSLPQFMVLGFIDIIVNALMKCSKPTPETEKWVESRRYAIKALTSLFNTVGIKDEDPKNSCRAHVLDLLDCMSEGLLDYTKDDRGDTGAWVREASMSGLQSLILSIAKEEPYFLTEKAVQTALSRITQQAVERIDRTRAIAGTVFSSLLHAHPEIPFIVDRSALAEIFPEADCQNQINWLSNADTFPRFVKLLALPGYRRPVLLGLIASIGGLTEGLVKISSGCLFDFLKEQNDEYLKEFCRLITDIYADYVKDDRVVLSMLSFLDRLISSGRLSPILLNPQSDFGLEVFNLTRTAVASTTDKFKLIGSIEIYCHLIQVPGEVRRKSLGRLQILLCHRFGWLRKLVASKLYETLMIYEEDVIADPVDYEEALSMLSSTEWSTLPVEDARSIRNKLSHILGIPVPKLIGNNANSP